MWYHNLQAMLEDELMNAPGVAQSCVGAMSESADVAILVVGIIDSSGEAMVGWYRVRRGDTGVGKGECS